jgi:uncharacterized DUF497 family protein
MLISYDAAKRGLTLELRGLDFEDAPQVFTGPTFDLEDDRKDYGETRWLTFGLLSERMVVLVWTPRDDTRHIISMRWANERERKKYEGRLDRPG